VPLAEILSRAGVRPEARFVVFHCADTLDDGESSVDPESTRYYESIDLIDAAHPQTILAYDMNDKQLTVPHGAPLRLRLERQLGYKMAKYIMRVELVQSLADLHGGRGGYWEDRGYEWYAGI
jgi:DMSO/TMAO reductase YedYZ molybdopterin-dependent catalytic subunit